MRPAVEGIYSDGIVRLNEKFPNRGKSKVLVVFLEDYQEEQTKREKLMSTFGAWEDERDPEQIISEVYGARVFRKADMSL